MHFEQFECQPERVEGDDHRDLSGRLELEYEEHGGHRDPVRQQCVVARNRERDGLAHRETEEDSDREQAALHFEPAEAN